MLHHLAGATIQIANLVKYSCHPLKDGNKIAPRQEKNKNVAVCAENELRSA